MAGYNTIRGLRVKYLSADPSNPEDGQVWYNSTTGNLRVDGILGTASWAAGGVMGTPVRSGVQAGTQTAALQAGGFTDPSTKYIATTQEYNGSSWANAAVSIPPPDRPLLAVVKAPPVDQLVPSYSEVTLLLVSETILPPTINPAV